MFSFGIIRVPTAWGKQGNWPKKNPCQGKYREFGMLPKHRENKGNFVWSSCKIP